MESISKASGLSPFELSWKWFNFVDLPLFSNVSFDDMTMVHLLREYGIASVGRLLGGECKGFGSTVWVVAPNGVIVI